MSRSDTCIHSTNHTSVYDHGDYEEHLRGLSASGREAVKKFWRSLLMRNKPIFTAENGPLLQCANVQSCNCCPYGYHIDLDFVRYCEALANAKPSEEELQRRSRRRSRKSMEFMLGLDNIFDEWDAASRVQTVPEVDSDLETLLQPTFTASTPHSTPLRQRSSSLSCYPNERCTSPFGTGSSTCSSVRATESDAAVYQHQHHSHKISNNLHRPETKALLTEALIDVCDDFERTLERASMKRKKHHLTTSHSFVGRSLYHSHSETNYMRDHLSNGYTPLDFMNGKGWNPYFDSTDSCISGNKPQKKPQHGPLSASRANTLPLLQKKLSPGEVQYESYVQATVAANAKSPVELEEDQAVVSMPSEGTSSEPPLPPKRFNYSHRSQQSTEVVKSPASASSPPAGGPQTSTDNSMPDAQTLYNIRQQMALSLKRMKDLEEQVKSIPDLHLELTQLKNEKQSLEQKLQAKEEELLRVRDVQRLSSPSSPSPNASPKYSSPVQFTAHRISPISLESLGNRIRTNSTSTVMKRDVGVMCSRTPTREVAVGSPQASLRSISTSPIKEFSLNNLNDPLYSQQELEQHIQLALRSYESEMLSKMPPKEPVKMLVSMGTQISEQPKLQRSTAVQTQSPKTTRMISVGLNAVAKTRDNSMNCKPEQRSVGSSDHSTTSMLCDNCSKERKSVACSTEPDSDLPSTKTKILSSSSSLLTSSTKSSLISLRHLDLPVRSNTFTLGENEKLNLKFKSIGTQYTPKPIHTTGCQTVSTVLSSVAIQSSPLMMTTGVQSKPTVGDCSTDTRDLLRLTATKTRSEEIAPPGEGKVEKPKTRSLGSNTDKIKTASVGLNTKPEVAKVKHAAINTDKVLQKDQCCGDAVKPHISITCADNYCDSCKDAIKNLAKEFSKPTTTTTTNTSMNTTPLSSPLLATKSVDSKIPRPKNLPSPLTTPTPQRRAFSRQNTYTVDDVPPPASARQQQPLAESSGPKSLPVSLADLSQQSLQPLRTLQEKPPTPTLSSQEKSSGNEGEEEQQQQQDEEEEEKRRVLQPSPSLESYNLTSIGSGDLIVREEKKVSVSWSRDASPAPLAAASTSQQPQQTSALATEPPTSVQEKLEAAAAALAHEVESSHTETSQGAEKASEEEPREKAKPPKEVMAALKQINDSLLKKRDAKSLSSHSLKATRVIIQNEWFRISSTEKSQPHQVEDYLECFESLSVPLLEYCVNMTDANGNTAMHYAVSHGNFDVVSKLLDSKVCNVNQMNNAGYTCVMLVSLAKLKEQSHRQVVERLFQMADVNVLAKKHSQTALMLAVSHGNLDIVELLLAAGADVNIQDEDGSTALMCAAEHGRIDLVKHILSQAECNSLIQDVDGSTAFKIAWQAGYKDISMLLYIHEQMLKAKMPAGGQKSPTVATSVTPAHLLHLKQQQEQLQKQLKSTSSKTTTTVVTTTPSSLTRPSKLTQSMSSPSTNTTTFAPTNRKPSTAPKVQPPFK